MLDVYLDFVHERHRIWERRQAGEPGPWTNDPVLRGMKFTNVYRVLDAGSQFVVKELLPYSETFGHHTALMRCFLYRYTNRPEPWQHFREAVGRYPEPDDLSGLLQDVWTAYAAAGHPVFSTAYKMFVGQENKGMTRLEWAMQLTKDNITEDKSLDLFLATDLIDQIDVLRTIPRCAGFMSMQITTDYNYWLDLFTENDYVVAGPGAVVGARHIDPDANPVDLIRELRLRLIDDGRIILPKIDRPPSLMDVQNTLCEFGKYVRWRDKPERKPYVGSGPQPPPFYPPHW